MSVPGNDCETRVPSQPQSSETNGRLAGSSLERAIEETAVRSGDIVNGKYRVERVLGVGGMGVVFRVTQIELDRPVALKVLASKVKHHKGAIERFTREARAAARIRSEHVGNILDVDKLPSGEPFIVMELLEGADLADLLAKRGALSIEVAAGYVMQACDGLRAAHAAGIVHRDLKPANLFLARVDEEKSVIKLLDFGISKLTQDETVALTSASEVMGSPLYMSPEQMQASRDVDARTDIWSLGVVLYELATARVPFDGKTTPMVAAAVLGKPPEPLGLPGERGVALEAIIVRCLQKNPEDRFGSARELANALRPLSGAMNPPSHAPVERSLDGTASLGEERAGPLPMQSATGVELRESSNNFQSGCEIDKTTISEADASRSSDRKE